MIETKKITGKINLLTGLRIGGSKDNINIGGIDNVIIRNPIDNKPYIPGSSIKGKMRFLMEWRLGKVENDGKVHNCDNADCPVCGLFGSSRMGDNGVPTRLIVRDAMLAKDSDAKIEEKVENSIDRLKGKALSPRTMERVAPGAKFDFEIVLRLFDGDNEKKWLDLTLEALSLLQSDYLGGSGSRGYGKIEFLSEEGYKGAVTINGQNQELPEVKREN